VLQRGGLAGLTTTEERVEGYRLGLRRNGLADQPSSVRHAGSDELVAAAVQELLAEESGCSALITGNNATTIATMAELSRLRVAVPEDLALVAFDDFPWADCFHPRLTAVRQPLEQLGRRSIELLLDRIAEPDRPARTERLTPTLVHRDSCGRQLQTAPRGTKGPARVTRTPREP
jgi:LacI family transcriptional regulator